MPKQACSILGWRSNMRQRKSPPSIRSGSTPSATVRLQPSLWSSRKTSRALRDVSAFAPAVELRFHIPLEAQRELAQLVPGADEFFTRFNPSVHESKIQCPLFLFFAEDDARFANQVRDMGARLQAQART